MQIFKWVPAKVEEIPQPPKQPNELVNTTTTEQQQQDSNNVNLQSSPEISISASNKLQNSDKITDPTKDSNSSSSVTTGGESSKFCEENSTESISNGQTTNGMNKENIKEVESSSNSQSSEAESQPNPAVVTKKEGPKAAVSESSVADIDTSSTKQDSSTTKEFNNLETNGTEEKPEVESDEVVEKVEVVGSESGQVQLEADSSKQSRSDKRNADSEADDGPPAKQQKLDESGKADKV